jgi:hypothetical protein
MGLFDGLESLGFGDIKEFDLFPVMEEKQKKKVKQELSEGPMDYLYIKNMECPVCVKQFETPVIRKSKLRVVDTETDFKTIYQIIDPNLYDVIQCNRCGYAALVTFFNHIAEKQKEIISEKITPRYIKKNYPLPLTLDNAIERYKMALLCAAVIGVKSSQKAILCLKTAWIYRDLNDKPNEQLFIKNALTGLIEAFKTESFPIGVMDEQTVKYMIGELSRRCGDFTEASKWIGEVVTMRGANKKMKERALTVKELIRIRSVT